MIILDLGNWETNEHPSTTDLSLVHIVNFRHARGEKEREKDPVSPLMSDKNFGRDMTKIELKTFHCLL